MFPFSVIPQSRTFYVLFGANQQPSNLILDWDNGFTLYDNWTNSNVWTYKFSELRGSSDDRVSRLKLHFNDNGRVETKVKRKHNDKTGSDREPAYT